MKHLLLSITLCLLLGSTFAQSRKDVRQYYCWINQAELAYDANQLEKSATFYERAFNQMAPFSRDINMYLLLYSYYHYGKEDVALNYAHTLAQRDDLWPQRYIGDTIFQNKLQVIKDTTVVLVNPLLKQALDSLFARDQSVRKSCLDSDETNRQAAITDSANMKILLDLFQQYGSVNECNAGERAYVIVELIFIHNSKTRDVDLPFYVLENAVKQGTYDARSYMHLYDDCMTWRSTPRQSQGTRYGTGFDHYMAYGNTLFIYPPDNIRGINENRKSLGVGETWNDFEKKLVVTVMSCGAGFVKMNTAVGGGENSEAMKASQIRAEMDSGKINGKYVIRENDCDGVFISQ